ncbi:MAG: aldehyde dehydrogenase [Chloroflexi bacterium]|nr:aldehyde dehydrogenase [Chloroflexota bacterium]
MSEKIVLNPQLNFIDGQRLSPDSELGGWLCNPNTGERLQPQRASSPAQIERALAAAARVHESGTWAARADRAELMEQIAAELEKRIEDMAQQEALTTGVVITLTRLLMQIAPLTFRQAAAQLRSGWTRSTLPGPHGAVEVLRQPWGAAALIAPWNAPGPIAAHKTANALAAGCPAILKPSEFAPATCNLIADAIEAVGLPPGVFQLVHGGAEVGAALVHDSRIRAVSFTGGLNGGRAVAAACAHDFKPAQLELGGNNPMVILEDADVELAAQAVVYGLITLNGQWCRALGRLLVHESLAHLLLNRVLTLLADVQIGDARAPESAMGPLIHAGHLRHVQGQIAALLEKGGTAHSTTPLPALPGYFLAPTLITGCAPQDTLDEIFGPVAVMHSFATDSEALALANQTPFGLAGYVFSRDEARALRLGRQIRSGGVKINGIGLVGLHPLAPRPAWGLSGFGEEGTEETFRFFCGTRVVGVAARS